MKLTLSNHESVAEWVKQIVAPVNVEVQWFDGSDGYGAALVVRKRTKDYVVHSIPFHPDDFLIEEEIVRWATS